MPAQFALVNVRLASVKVGNENWLERKGMNMTSKELVQSDKLPADHARLGIYGTSEDQLNPVQVLRGGNLRSCILAFFAAWVFSGCQARDESLKWTEDVRLPDGRVVTLTRYQEFKGPHELGETPSASDYWFEFKHPDTGETVRWQSDRDLATLALMFDGKAPVLLAMPEHRGFDRRGCPNPPYVLFRRESGLWRELPIANIPVKRLRVNMTFSPDDARKRIEASNRRLTADQTADSFHNHRPYVLNFSQMGEQTFRPENCGRTLNLLIEK